MKVVPCGMQTAECHPPWLTDGRVAAGQRSIFKVREAIEVIKVRNQHFPAPDAAIDAVAGAVEAEADHGTVEGVFGHASGDMGVVVCTASRGRFFSFAHCVAHFVDRYAGCMSCTMSSGSISKVRMR